MTIVVAMRTSDTSILIAADGEVTGEGGYKSRKVKLTREADLPLLWAASGNEEIGYNRFPRRLETFDWSEATWDSVDEVAEILFELNGKQRRWAELAGVRIGPVEAPSYLARCLIVGWLKGEPRILTIGDDGTVSNDWDTGFAAIGSGAPYAIAAYNTLGGGTPGEQAMKVIMDGAIHSAPNCGPPAECWRITEREVATVFTLPLPPQPETDSSE